jgi:hypothetical protein
LPLTRSHLVRNVSDIAAYTQCFNGRLWYSPRERQLLQPHRKHNATGRLLSRKIHAHAQLISGTGRLHTFKSAVEGHI